MKTYQDIKDQVIAYRQHFHRYPEVGNEEVQTSAFIEKVLIEHDIQILRFELNTGVVATVGKGDHVVVLRCDMDAIELEEAPNMPVLSEVPGVSHACGHDMHMAALLATAILLKEREDELTVRIIFLFQPSEENNEGAKEIIDSGLLKQADCLIGFHNEPDLPLGVLGLTKEVFMAAVDQLTVEINGEGGHAGYPHISKDPTITAAYVMIEAQSIISRKLNPLEAAVLSFTTIHGGSSWNAIPTQVKLEGTVRTFSESARELLKREVRQLVMRVAANYDCESEVEIFSGPGPVKNDPEMVDIVLPALQERLPVVEPEKVFAGDDFGFYQELLPTVYAFVGTGCGVDWHSPDFQVNDEAIETAVIYYMTSLEALENYWAKASKVEQSLEVVGLLR